LWSAPVSVFDFLNQIPSNVISCFKTTQTCTNT
jgi:hypothetical protein